LPRTRTQFHKQALGTIHGLPGQAERVRECLRQGAVFDGVGGFLYVIVEPDEFDPDAILVGNAAAVVDIEQDVTPAGIAVLGFPHGTDVDGMAEAGNAPGAEGRGRSGRWLVRNGWEDAMIGLVGMALMARLLRPK
jgi:hypothetical protein